MNFIIQKKEFLRVLNWVQAIAEKKTSMPILANTLIEAKQDHLKLSATDLEVGIISECKAKVQVQGKICAQAKHLYEIIREINQEEIEISLQDQCRLEIKAGKSLFKIPALSPEEFPKLMVQENSKTYFLPTLDLKEMIDKTQFAISLDESRYNLHGVFLEPVGQEKLRMVATDGHRLSYLERNLSEPLPLEKGVIIPKKAVLELKRLLSEEITADQQDSDQDQVKINFDLKNVKIQRGGIVFLIRLIDGEFPDYKPVIPKNQQQIVSANRLELIGALKRVSLLVNDKLRGVRFGLSKGMIEIFASNSDLGEAREELNIDYGQDSFHIGFNARYFLDALSCIEDEKVQLEFNGEVGPCVIKSPSEAGFLSVIMPMRI